MNRVAGRAGARALGLLGVLCAGFVATGVVAVQSGAAALSEGEMVAFLTQSLCLDAEGRPTRATPLDARCTRRRPQTLADRATYRRHDRPDGAGLGQPRGAMASDAVLGPAGGRTIVTHTFDFGDATRAFRHFDAGQGDGGQVAVFSQGRAWFVFTEDGGDGAQWFVGAGCRAGEPDGRVRSWLVMGDDVVRGRWTEAVASLNKTRAADACPTRFNSAYTRYRRETVPIPFRLAGRGGRVRETVRATDTVISEHYGGTSLERADHLERFFLARDFGMVRWERWEQAERTRQPDVQGRGEAFARTQRCPAIAYGDAPGPGWVLVDCRLWTTLIPETGPAWSVAEYGWPGEIGPALGP